MATGAGWKSLEHFSKCLAGHMFENSFREQWVFTLDRANQRGELRGGDMGWNSVHVVENAHIVGLILGVEEAAWLQACWRAAVPKRA